MNKSLGFNHAVNFEKEVIYVAIPKTGTTSITSQLIERRKERFIKNPHLTILQIRDGLYPYFLVQQLGSNRSFPTDRNTILSDQEIREKAKSTFENFFKFSSVRNPWARVASLYNRKEGSTSKDIMSFEEFCEQIRFASDTCFHPTRCENQLDWITDENGELAVDYVLRLENFDDCLDEIEELTNGRLGLASRKKNVNEGSFSDRYREFYNQRTRNLIGDLFQKDIEFFGYDF